MTALQPAGRFSHLLAARTNQTVAVWDRPLVEGENFVAVPSKGSIVPGWALLVPKRHSFSFRQLSSYEICEAQKIAERVCETLTRCFGPVTVFEHGAAFSGSALGCGVDHAHLHMVSLDIDLIGEALSDQTLHWQPLSHWSEIHRKTPEYSEYLLMGKADGNAFISNAAPSTKQYFRKLIARLHGMSDQWDYRFCPFAENARATLQAFASERANHSVPPTSQTKEI